MTETASLRHFGCSACGAQLTYAPGTASMQCPYCGAAQEIVAEREAVEEHSFDVWAALPPKPVATLGKQVLRCTGCGASIETDMLADACQFCGATLISDPAAVGLVVPEAVVPFSIDQSGAKEAFRRWVKTRWFAPGALKRIGSTERIKGTYLPHWTYDARTATDYHGQRGEHYWETESYTTTDGEGNTRTETRQVQRTAWYPASGHVSRDFDDVLVTGTTQLGVSRIEKMGPWQLGNAKPYQSDYLAGYAALRYDVDPDVGLERAKNTMQAVIENDCEDDIGGDEQRVSSMSVAYAEVMFKLVLLPLWIATYLYAGRTFQVMVNANTGEVVGDRPYSKGKIAAAVVAGLIVAAVVAVLYVRSRH